MFIYAYMERLEILERKLFLQTLVLIKLANSYTCIKYLKLFEFNVSWEFLNVEK